MIGKKNDEWVRSELGHLKEDDKDGKLGFIFTNAMLQLLFKTRALPSTTQKRGTRGAPKG
jgi:hypothetical protein